jgi:uncharacterized protein
MQNTTLKNQVQVPGGHARAFEVRRGQFLKVIDLEGGQVADFMAFNRADRSEKLSPTHTRTSLLSLRFTVGDQLRSNFRNPMFAVVEDTVGCHDFMLAACDAHRYLVDYGVSGHRNCVDNFEEALRPYSIGCGELPDPFNFFQNTAIDLNGKLTQQASQSHAGDFVVLEALMDVVAAVSACPMDLNPIGGDKITDILININDRP